MKKLLKALKASVKNLVKSINHFFKSIFQKSQDLVNFIHKKYIIPLLKFFYHYFILTIYKFFYYIVFIPSKYLVIMLAHLMILIGGALSYFFLEILYKYFKKSLCFIYKYVISPFYNKIIIKVKNGIIWFFSLIYEQILVKLGNLFIKAFKTFYKYLTIIITSIGKAIKITAHYIAIPIKFIANLIVKTAHQINLFFKTLFNYIGKFLNLLGDLFCSILVKVCEFIYNYFLYPVYFAIKTSISFIWKYIKKFFDTLLNVFKFISDAIYKYLLYPIYFLIIKLSTLFYTYLLYPLYKLFIKLGLLIYNYILYPIYFAIRFTLIKLYQFIKFIITKSIKIIQLVYQYIKKFLIYIYEKIKPIIISIYKHFIKFIKSSAKFFYQFGLVIIFLPLIILFYLITTFFSMPIIIIKEAFKLIKNDEINFSRRIFLNFIYIFKSIHLFNNEKLKKFKSEKNDLYGLLLVKNYVSILTSSIWLLLLYPINILLITFIGAY